MIFHCLDIYNFLHHSPIGYLGCFQCFISIKSTVANLYIYICVLFSIVLAFLFSLFDSMRTSKLFRTSLGLHLLHKSINTVFDQLNP